uniref:Uncharacterized protein n=1 Tax=Timema douglasi TaxID=61478 RepID=A0A7R8ZII5_TIMDO|nr:unnamed protein product [Timema douglasi]
MQEVAMLVLGSLPSQLLYTTYSNLWYSLQSYEDVYKLSGGNNGQESLPFAAIHPAYLSTTTTHSFRGRGQKYRPVFLVAASLPVAERTKSDARRPHDCVRSVQHVSLSP